MVMEFVAKNWEWFIIGFLLLNTIIQKIEKIKGKSDILTGLAGVLKFIQSFVKKGVNALFSSKIGKLPIFFFAILLSVTFITANVYAEPFLKAGATLNCTKWQIDLDGVIIDVDAILSAESGDPATIWMKYDLASVSEGAHLVKVRAGNAWGWSIWYPLEFIKATADVTVKPFIE